MGLLVEPAESIERPAQELALQCAREQFHNRQVVDVVAGDAARTV